jgi:hypothetical protein
MLNLLIGLPTIMACLVLQAAFTFWSVRLVVYLTAADNANTPPSGKMPPSQHSLEWHTRASHHVCRAHDRLIDSMQPTWQRSRNIPRSPQVRDLICGLASIVKSLRLA